MTACSAIFYSTISNFLKFNGFITDLDYQCDSLDLNVQFSYLERARKLKTERSEKIEDTIHNGYTHHIRRAHNYIFIENQYFLGTRTQGFFPHC